MAMHIGDQAYLQVGQGAVWSLAGTMRVVCVSYRELVGNLMYLMVGTRPELAFF